MMQLSHKTFSKRPTMSDKFAFTVSIESCFDITASWWGNKPLSTSTFHIIWRLLSWVGCCIDALQTPTLLKGSFSAAADIWYFTCFELIFSLDTLPLLCWDVELFTCEPCEAPLQSHSRKMEIMWTVILAVGFHPVRCYQKELHSPELKCSKSWRGLCVLAWATALWEGLLLCCDLQTCFHCKHGRSLTWCTVLLFCPPLQQGVSCSQPSLDRPWHLDCLSCFSE